MRKFAWDDLIHSKNEKLKILSIKYSLFVEYKKLHVKILAMK